MATKRLRMTTRLGAARQVGWVGVSALVLVATTWSVRAQNPPADSIPATVTFNRDIRPILSDKCYKCHGPDSQTRRAQLRWDNEEGAKKAATATPGTSMIIASGDPEHSALMQRVISSDPKKRMPLGLEPLKDREIKLITKWIEQGAKWEPLWSFIPPVRAELPKVADKAWPKNGIDWFVLERLEREGLKPSAEADRSTLIRRVSFDLTGLPPTLAEIDAFLADRSPNAYEKVVDRLLASPRYGERMAAMWMAPARYADTSGDNRDPVREMSRWRDWVIDAFNDNMRFDRFTVEQLAGDLLPNPTIEQKIASGFMRNQRLSSEAGASPDEKFADNVADRVTTLSTVWLGLTVGCARCHDHKFDPIKQKDFYQFGAYFNSIAEAGLGMKDGNSPPVMYAPTREQQKQLKQLDDKVAAAEKAFAALRPEIETAQRQWEKSVGESPQVEILGSLDSGLSAYFPLASEAEHRFDGVRYVDAGTVGRLGKDQAFTMAAWIEPAAPSGPILTQTNLTAPHVGGYSLLLKDGKLEVNLTQRYLDDGMNVETVDAIPSGRHHVAVTYDGSKQVEGLHIYVDGKAVKHKVIFNALTGDFTRSDRNRILRIGAGGGPDRFRGSMSDVRLYKVSLAPDQVAAVAEPRSVSEIALIPPAQRTKPQADKIDAYFFEHRMTLPAVEKVLTQLQDARNKKAEFEETLLTVMVMQELPEPREWHLLTRGNFDQPGEKVERATPSWLPPMPEDAPNNRLGLAMWVVDPSNPLTARVTINRFWEMTFGSGLVKTVDNFGSQGEPPSHPELLDWLATEFIRTGWDIKAMEKLMVTSATYRQASNVSSDLLERDPENRLLARGPRYRLPAEMVRDQVLAISGLLSAKMGGPSVKPYQPDGMWDEGAGQGVYVNDHGENLYRRSLYTFWRRAVSPPSLSLFDAAERDNTIVGTSRTNTPLQALNLMNDVAYVEASRMLAERMLTEGGKTPVDRVAFAFRLATARTPTEAELSVLLKSFRYFRQQYQTDREAALKLLGQGEHPRNETLDVAELAANAAVASVIFNLDQVVTKQ